MIRIGSGIACGYDTTTPEGPVRVYRFPGGISRLHLRHTRRVIETLRVRETEDAWNAPVHESHESHFAHDLGSSRRAVAGGVDPGNSKRLLGQGSEEPGSTPSTAGPDPAA